MYSIRQCVPVSFAFSGRGAMVIILITTPSSYFHFGISTKARGTVEYLSPRSVTGAPAALHSNNIAWSSRPGACVLGVKQSSKLVNLTMICACVQKSEDANGRGEVERWSIGNGPCRWWKRGATVHVEVLRTWMDLQSESPLAWLWVDLEHGQPLRLMAAPILDLVHSARGSPVMGAIGAARWQSFVQSMQ